MLTKKWRVFGMVIELETYDALPCHHKVFKIDGHAADKDWFGENLCHGPAPDYCCGDNYFEPASVAYVRESMAKEEADFELSDMQISAVQGVLKEVFSIGDCGWCE